MVGGALGPSGPPLLAWHLSGGTTELLHVAPQGWNLACTRIGGTTDISAGQLIDRTGRLLGLPFPSGKELDRLSRDGGQPEGFRVRCPELEFSLSGVQNQVEQFFARTESREKTAAFALASVCQAVLAATRHAVSRYPGLPVVFSGGVASNSMLRERMAQFRPVFARPNMPRTTPWAWRFWPGGVWRKRMEQQIYSVTQVNTYIQSMMDSDRLLAGLCVRGRAQQL